MKVLRHVYHAIRYGVWDCGWESYKDKPKFGFYTAYYDGHWGVFHCGKFYICVNY